ncbi:hypothetical protein ACOSP7_024316 [Xanthoceras sorbifolium]
MTQNSPSEGDQEDDFGTSLRTVQDEFFGKRNWTHSPPNFNSSEPVAGANICDGSDAGSKTIAALLKEFFPVFKYSMYQLQ